MSILVAVACSERGVAPLSPNRSVKTSRWSSVNFERASCSSSFIIDCSMSFTQSCWLGATRSPNVVAESELAG